MAFKTDDVLLTVNVAIDSTGLRTIIHAVGRCAAGGQVVPL